jgi:hypothetical protein
MLAFAFMTCLPIQDANAEQLVYDSFEVVDASGYPVGWQRAGHPSYIGAPLENNVWQTPYGQRGMSTYGSGVATKTVGFIPDNLDPEEASGDYLVKFNISSSAAKGEYRAEFWAIPFVGQPILVGFAVGDTDGSKNMSFSGQISWRYNYNSYIDSGFSTMEGAELQLKLMQDPNRSDWRNTPIWDNVSVDWLPDVDTSGPTLVDILNDNQGGLVVATNSTVIYTVVFSEPMNAATVNPADFGNAAAADITITSVTPTANPAVFLVAVKPTTEGTLRLKIDENADLSDTAGNPMELFQLVQDDVTFTVEAGTPILLPVDIVDNRNGAPMAMNTQVTYTLTFSKDMNHSTVDAADFGNAGSAPITIGAITETTPGVFTVVVVPTGSGTVQFRVNAGVLLQSADGKNLNTSEEIADNTILIVDSDPPTLVEFQNDSAGNPVLVGDLVTYDVFFSEAMNAATVEASDFSNAITVGAAPFTIQSIAQASAEVYRIEIMPTGPGQIQLRINAGAVLQDLVGNALNTAVALLDESTVTVTDSAGDPYLAWSGGAAFDADANADGIPNGIAWFLGAAGPMADVRGDLPVPTIDENGMLVLAFRCLKPTDRGSTSLKVQFSSDLGLAATWAANEAEVPGVSSTVGNIVFDITDEGTLHYVEAKMDVAEGRMFGRLIGETQVP